MWKLLDFGVDKKSKTFSFKKPWISTTYLDDSIFSHNVSIMFIIDLKKNIYFHFTIFLI